MKKRIQKYLSGSNEGFSLVELIIVIAIMAILVGVVALAVIPNLERSRESKDLSTLDSCASALAVAVANAGAKARDGSLVISCNGSDTTTTDSNASAVLTALKEQIDPKTITLGSSAASGKVINLIWKTSDGQNQVIAQVDNGAGELKYAQNDKDGDTDKNLLKVIGSNKTNATN